MNSYVALTSLRIKCPWGYYCGLLKMLRNSLLGITAKKNYAARIAAKNQEATHVLIDRQIRDLCVNKGMISPYSDAAVQPCSYDIHLGKTIKIERPDGFHRLDLSPYSKEHPLLIKPGVFFLAETVEHVNLPDNVEAHLHLVSSRAREGLQHLLAGLVDCGWKGVLTLELKNVLQYGFIPIYPNLRIAQLTFFEYLENAQNPYRGRYFGDTGVNSVKDGSDLLQL
jgi:dCTP deaminase